MNKIIVILMAVTFIVSSCNNIKNISSETNQIWWVSGIKTECSGGVRKMNCLNIHKGEDINNPTWENFYSNIEGFEFEEGYLKKIEIKLEHLDPENVPADASSIKYTLVKELAKEMDFQMNANGKWTLVRLNDKPINRSIILPTMEINLNKKQVSGNGGCNNYSGLIEGITSNTIQFGNILSTQKVCSNKDVEHEYHAALSSVNSYKIKGSNLIFYNSEGEKLLSYMKDENKKSNQRIHDIWVAVRIDGNPINRMTVAPRLEINLTENKIMGNDSCNDYRGSIEGVSDTQLKFGPIASTKKMCRNMEVADSFNKAMNKVISYELKGLNLILKDTEGKEVLTFLKVD